MGRYSAGKQWEDLNRKRQEAEDQELEAQKAAAYQQVRAQVGGLPSITSANATLLFSSPQNFQDSRSRYHRRQEDMLELEAQDDPPPQYRPHTPPLTPPDFDGDGPEMDSDARVRYLEKEVIRKESEIIYLEHEVGDEQDKRLRLQAERHEAVDAQRRAEDEVLKLKSRVANLDQLLERSIKWQKELESELDLSRQEVRQLKKQLYEEGCNYDSDIRTRERREKQIRQDLDDTKGALENYIGKDGRSGGDVPSLLEREAQNVPNRSQRRDKGTSGKAYVSIPKRGNRRALWFLS